MIVLKFIDAFFLAYTVMLFIRIISSWFPEYADSRFMQFIAFYTDPYLNIFRNLIPPLGFLDISPIFAFIMLQVIEGGLKLLVYQFI
jgi:YggT family protein